jgi:hypothetical protein
MGRKGTAARRRAREGLAPVKPGKVGWVHGTKVAFFKKFKKDYLAAAELNRTGAFYSWIAQNYLATYGYNIPWDGNLEEGQTVADNVDPAEDVDSLSIEEGEERAAYYTKLRGVSSAAIHRWALLTYLTRKSGCGTILSTAGLSKKN